MKPQISNPSSVDFVVRVAKNELDKNFWLRYKQTLIGRVQCSIQIQLNPIMWQRTKVILNYVL